MASYYVFDGGRITDALRPMEDSDSYTYDIYVLITG